MTSQQEEIRVECWCYREKRQVIVFGVLQGKRQAELLKVTDCSEFDVERGETFKCRGRGDLKCLIGKVREGRWKP